MMKPETCILGAGMTGVAAGWASGLPIYEAQKVPGGICSSYYMKPGSQERLTQAPKDGAAYRFEIGGGHWIFGGDPVILKFIDGLTPVKTYQRRSSIFFPGEKLYVPYPIQNHLSYLGKEIALQAVNEVLSERDGNPTTMAEWLEHHFGPTLNKLFFSPFHELYTAGLWKNIIPQDGYKSPVNNSLIIQGASHQTQPVGYNVTFIYPQNDLGALALRMAQKSKIQYNKRAIKIDLDRKEILFEDHSRISYDRVISTLPLNKMIELTDLTMDNEKPDPFTSVLVLNIGATRGPQCPQDHWLYIPKSQSGFHRVGFYSNVDTSFLPIASRLSNDRVSIYVERAYPGGEKPSKGELEAYTKSVVKELQAWDFIKDIEVLDPTWIDVAYTWSFPNSKWKTKALKALEHQDIFMIGRYGRWIFQGIADSIRDGLFVGAAMKAANV